MPGTTNPRKATRVAGKPSAKKAARKAPASKTAATKRTASTAPVAKQDAPRRLSGGNPQIPKGYGDAPVQAYIDAMPGWKRDVWRRLDTLIETTLPNVRKAVKWNSPLYGAHGDEGWFLGVHCFTRYIKVSFFLGASLKPMPPGESKMAHVRYLDIHENEPVDVPQFKSWLEQASKLPGEKM
ncbi:DUF1801 domain-containing protein [Lysobacter arvi]|uniref:DUF1801 domain-containing protein n=1 Tax=Lysobacter arvi TaxID=3038776 RepID=A0ABU1CDI8_9GAMM|nr:DUF1801 domain-containing protein [Lysobacter arvi]MDR0183237.1 DUF1801 domain-containing protein [Lysobacter arvi]